MRCEWTRVYISCQIPFTNREFLASDFHDVTSRIGIVGRRRFGASKSRLLFELSQMADSNETRSAFFREDLRRFVGLTDWFPPAYKIAPEKQVVRRKKSDRSKYKIDLCDPAYKDLRAALWNMPKRPRIGSVSSFCTVKTFLYHKEAM